MTAGTSAPSVVWRPWTSAGAGRSGERHSYIPQAKHFPGTKICRCALAPVNCSDASPLAVRSPSVTCPLGVPPAS